jgi:Ohr subfamily peroxiredoxin
MVEVLYTARAKATDGRNGPAETDDGALKLKLASPGSPRAKQGTTNPEQLFACAYAACFGSALEFVAQQQKIKLVNPEILADIALRKNGNDFFISATLNIGLPGLEKGTAEKLVQAAHRVCPYSKAVQGNIKVFFNINNPPLSAVA